MTLRGKMRLLERAAAVFAPKPTKPRRHKLEPGQCDYCDTLPRFGNDFHPSHDASPRCESGKRDHCSCDTCF